MVETELLHMDGDGRGSPRRRLPASERRALVLGAALRIFAAKGYDGAAMDEIAAAAGVSKAVVYDHVASKRELYEQLLEAIRHDLERTVADALAPAGPGGEPRVRAAVAAIYRYVERHPDTCRLLLLELQGGNVSAVGRQLEERIAEQLARALGEDEALFDGHPDRERQLLILAELLKSAVLGLTGWWYRHPEAPRELLVERTTALAWPAIERVRLRRS